MQITRIPSGPSSAAKVRESPSIAAHATPNPAVSGIANRAGEADSIKMTPDLFFNI
jgi:hypothetical protein